MLAARIILLGLLAILLWYCLGYLPTSELADFSVYREAAGALLRGEDIYGQGFRVSQRAAQLSLGYLYPPLLAVVLSWGEAFLPGGVPLLWCAMLLLAVLLSAIILARLVFAFENHSPSVSWWRQCPSVWAMVFLLAWPPLWDGLMWGQVNPFVLLAILGASLSAAQGRPAIAGALIAVAAALKATPAILLLPFIMQRTRPGIVGFGITAVLSVLLCLLSPRGFEVLFDFSRALSQFAAQPLSIDPFYDYGIEKLVGNGPAKLVGVLFVGFYGAGLFLVQRSKQIPESRKLAFGIVMGVPIMVLLSPCIWFHHLLWLVPPLTLCFIAWGTSEQLRSYRAPVLSFLGSVLGLSLYLHVIARHHLGAGETTMKALVPVLIFAVFGCLTAPLLVALCCGPKEKGSVGRAHP